MVKPSLSIFLHHPVASFQCVHALYVILSSLYKVSILSASTIGKPIKSDLVIFPGGSGDADIFDDIIGRAGKYRINNYLLRGGRYLGICMGAYWAGSHYFKLLTGLDEVQYIKRGAEINRSFSTVASVVWNGHKEEMFFYDGAAFVGSGSRQVIASYSNGDDMAIIQNRIGLIGCHPESQLDWYSAPQRKYWHSGRHHILLRNMITDLLAT